MFSKYNNNVGDIGCQVQEFNSGGKPYISWVITSFSTLAANSLVKIFGYIDLPSDVSADTSGFWIYSYSDSYLQN